MKDLELEKLQDAAKVGNAEAIGNLIDYYLANNEINKAKMEAERLRFISTVFAYKKLANLYLNGTLIDEDNKLAKEYLSKAYELGDIDSGYNLALLLLKENRPQEALNYLTIGVSKDHIPSLKLLAHLYLKGEIVNKDLDISLSLLKKVHELGDVSIITTLGKISYQLERYDDAVKYFTIGVNYHDLDAIYHLGLCYAKGLGVAQDFNKARFYYEMGANLNDPNCLYNLSLYYRNGITVNQNTALADTLLAQAIEHGFKK